MGDFKECMDHNPDGTRKVMGGEECHLVNEMKHCHPGKQLPNMYVQGHQSFDYALATEPVTMAVQHTGYEPVNSHFPTDHRPYYIDLSAPISFGLHLQLWAKYEPSFLVATNIHQVTAYTEKNMNTYLCKHTTHLKGFKGWHYQGTIAINLKND